MIYIARLLELEMQNSIKDSECETQKTAEIHAICKKASQYLPGGRGERGGGEIPHKKDGMLVGNFEINP